MTRYCEVCGARIIEVTCTGNRRDHWRHAGYVSPEIRAKYGNHAASPKPSPRMVWDEKSGTAVPEC